MNSIFHKRCDIIWKIFLSGFFFVILNSTTFAQVAIKSSFHPNTITLSNSSIYKVIIEGSQSSPKGSIPTVSGLEISNNPQTFRKVSLVNGVSSVTLELSFVTKPKREGTFQVPSWQIVIEGRNYQVPSTTLRVLSPSQNDLLRQQKENQQEENLKQAAFIEFSLPRKYLFEGETIVSDISLFLWDRMPFTRIENAPVKVGEAFSLTELGQPSEKRNVKRFNKNYSSYSWTVGLTAAIPGKHSLAYHSNVRIRTNDRRNSPFNSPFFNDPFFGFGREESIQVKSNEEKIEIRPLPMNGRPSFFEGAIGTFETSVSIDAQKVSLGDPVRLTFSISGMGNFSAMPAPSLSGNSEFKIGSPAFSFSGDQRTKYTGTQLFEYIITPLVSGLLDLPTPDFAFFNPKIEQYQSIPREKLKIQVDPGEQWIEPNQVNLEEGKEKKTVKVQNTLFQTESDPGTWKDDFTSDNVFRSFWYWGLQCIPMMIMITITLFGFKKRTLGIESDRQIELKMLKELKKSYSINDPSGFYRSYRSLIQFKVGCLNKHPNPSSLSSQELLDSLIKINLKSNSLNKIKDSLSRIDDYEFGSSNQSKIELKKEYQSAVEILKQIK